MQIQQISNLKDKIDQSKQNISKIKKSKLKFNTSVNSDVQQCINKIQNKMVNTNIQTLHPPYFQHTLTTFRKQCFSHKLKKNIHQKLSSQVNYLQGLNILEQFIVNFDQQHVDNYILQIKQPYIRKIYNDGYQIDKANFRKLNSQFELRKQIQQVLNQTSQWLTQIELLEDILNRIQLYFNIPFKTIMEKIKAKGAQQRKGGWGDYFMSLVRKTGSYALRKSSKIVQNTYYASLISPAFALLTWAIIGGSSTLPWKGGLDIKSLIIPAIAYTIPYILDNLAQGIQRKDFQTMLINWAIQFSQINNCLKKFNNMLLQQIRDCYQSTTYVEYSIHKTNLQKYMKNIEKNVDKISGYDQKFFQEMKQRTQAYYTQYIQIQEDGWKLILTPQQSKQLNNQLKQIKKE